jgi:transcriptional regulator with GAF, ATPase, and Fis domain
MRTTRFPYSIARNLLNGQDYGELLANLLDATIHALGADRGCIVVHENGRFRATVERNFRNEALLETEERISSTIARTAVAEGQILVIGDAQKSERFRTRSSVRRLGLRSVLCAPMIARDEAFALIYLENRDISNCFGERQQQILAEICSLAGPRLQAAVETAQAARRARELENLTGETDGIVSADSAMANLLQSVSQVAPTDLPVLIQGETGTGKELFARAVYRRSRRTSGPFVIVNCAAIPANLIESELFGHVRGAFTDAKQDRIGLIGSANRGTLFLDEIGEMPYELQARLLRVLQSGDFTRLGSVRQETVDVRVVAASNRDLEKEVDEGRFRSDLYFRLSAVTLRIPPLRERPHDVELLANHFLKAYATRYGRVAPRLSEESVAALSSCIFPGNVRELEGEMARLSAVSTPGETIPVTALSPRILGRQRKEAQTNASIRPMSLAEMENRLIVSVLEHTNGNRTRAAEVLGISREGLRAKLQKLHLGDTKNALEPE